LGDNVLVTGGAGLIGSHLAEGFLTKGRTVHVLDNLSTGCYENIPEGATFTEGDICDADFVMALFKLHKFDIVCHFAAKPLETISHWIRRDIYNTNVLGSVNLINAALATGVKWFIFASSVDVENIKPDPYGISKLAIEMDLDAAYNQFGMKTVSVRMSNVYGPRMCIGEVYRNVIGRFIHKLSHGEPLPVMGDGHYRRPFTYVRDITDMISKHFCYEMNGGSGGYFTIAHPRVYSINHVADRMATLWNGKGPDIEWLPGRPNDPHEIFFHSHVECPTSLDVGLAETMKWAQEGKLNRRSSVVTPEITRDIPEVWRPHLK